MKFCQPHWDALHSAIDERGLSGFVATDGALARIASGEAETLDTFDALMGAHFVIVDLVGRLVGRPAFFIEGCPLCYVRDGHALGCTDPTCTFDPDAPIQIAADAALARYTELKLEAGR